MIELSYNFSQVLKNSLRKIGFLRAKILFSPLSPKTELELRWEAGLSRLYCSLNLSDNPLSKPDIQKILTLGVKKPKEFELEVINYKKAMNYICQDWLVCPKPISVEVVLALHKIICPHGQFRRNQEKELRQFLDYLQVKPESPIITAALTQIQIANTNPFLEKNGLTARLLAYLILYKNGYDFRGLLDLEEYWHRDFTNFRKNIKNGFNKGNLTLWLEYFSRTVIVQLEKAAKLCVFSDSLHLSQPASFWKLNERQKEILGLLEEPGLNITNRKVQKLFAVSQITASRDLAKLTTLGLLWSHGKGRSVYYSKV